jgi:hypothetical protein
MMARESGSGMSDQVTMERAGALPSADLIFPVKCQRQQRNRGKEQHLWSCGNVPDFVYFLLFSE